MRLRFVWSESVAEEAAATFAKHAQRIHDQIPTAEVRHTGGTSIAGALTEGDVDLHVRVEDESFQAAREVLDGLYRQLYPEAWTAQRAFFIDSRARPVVEVALTMIGGIDDLHHGEAWHRLGSDPDLLAEYNRLKLAHQRRPRDQYLSAKREFFERIVASLCADQRSS